MWILAINPGHNGSTALLHDKELVMYIEEDRLSKVKYDGNPYLGMEEALKLTDTIDHFVICGTSNRLPMMPWTGEDAYTTYVRKKIKNAKDMKVHKLGDEHHMTHAWCAFYNSGFESALAVIVDGAGSSFNDQDGNTMFEIESLWRMELPTHSEAIFKRYGSNSVHGFTEFNKEGGYEMEVSDGAGITKLYESVTNFLGFHFIEAGKTMGLAPYGKPNDSLPPLNIGLNTNRHIVKPIYPAGALIRSEVSEELRAVHGDQTWHSDPTAVTDTQKDMAYAVQEATEQRMFALIRKGIEATGLKKVVIAGGYGLNCVANYKFLKEFPDVEFFVDPVSHDGGTAIGAVRAIYNLITEDKTPVTNYTAYLGPKSSNNYSAVESLIDFDVVSEDAAGVAKLISEENIVCLFQGRSEAGPRALGNRSILFDPRVKNGKDIVNEVKHREWFRPFAGSCLAEKAKEWFDLASLDESPWMMYAVDVLPEKCDIVPSITHVDGTCRIQTVKPSQNAHYYELIKEFDKLTGVPILFNTSFNLGGEALVETLDDALDTLRRSELKYLWLPELGKLLIKNP